MDERTIKVLLIEDDLDHIQLIEEALAELEEVQFSRTWLQAGELLQVESIAEGLELLRQEACDVALLDVDLPDGRGPQALRRVQEDAPELPVVLLVNKEDEAQALSLVRQGAQDFLVKSEIDCIPMARAIQCAIERQRFCSALKSLSFVDDLTGLYSPSGFHRLAAQQCALAARLGAPVRCYLIELEGLNLIQDNFGTQERDMTLILATETLTRVFDEVDIVGRLDLSRFGVVSLAGKSEWMCDVPARLEESLAVANNRRGGQCPLSCRVGTANGSPGTSVESLLEMAEQSLCENGRSTTVAVRVSSA